MLTTSKRGNEVLLHLKNHGPLSTPIIQRMMNPTMWRNSVKKSLDILRQDGLIRRWYILGGQSGLAFYEIAQSPEAREAVAKRLDSHPDELIKPFYRRQDLIHHQWCEYWIYLFKQRYPEAEIIRESEIDDNEFAKERLIVIDDKREVYPDFLLVLTSEHGSRKTVVAVEIERTRKSNKRIIRKLKKYSTETTIDGLLYVCEGGRLSTTIGQLWQGLKDNEILHIAYYRDHFLLLSDAIGDLTYPFDEFLGLNRNVVKIDDWIGVLRTTKREFARSVKFKNLGLPTQQNSAQNPN